MSDFRTPFTLLAEVPEERMWICGDNDGNLLTATYEFHEYTPAELWQRPIVVPDGTNVLRLPIAPDLSRVIQGDSDRLEIETDNIEIAKIVIQDRFALRCGFGKKSRRWAVKGELIRRPKD